MADRVEEALSRAALWDEVKDIPAPAGHRPFRGPAAAAVHRPGPGGGAGSLAHGRTHLRHRPHRHRQDRGIDQSPEKQTTPSSLSPTICSRPPGSPTSPPSSIRDISSSSAKPKKSLPTLPKENRRVYHRPVRVITCHYPFFLKIPVNNTSRPNYYKIDSRSS